MARLSFISIYALYFYSYIGRRSKNGFLSEFNHNLSPITKSWQKAWQVTNGDHFRNLTKIYKQKKPQPKKACKSKLNTIHSSSILLLLAMNPSQRIVLKIRFHLFEEKQDQGHYKKKWPSLPDFGEFCSRKVKSLTDLETDSLFLLL